MAKRKKVYEDGTSTWALTPEEQAEQEKIDDARALRELLELAARGGGPRYSALMLRLSKKFGEKGEAYRQEIADRVRAMRVPSPETGLPAPTEAELIGAPPAGAAPRIPQRTEPYGGAGLGGYLPTPNPQWSGLGGYAPPGATPEMLAPYQERISATTEMARNRLADIIRRWEDFKAAQSWRGAAAPAPWGGTAMPGAMPPTAMPQAPVAQNPIERLRQRQLQAQQGLQQQALAGQQARQAAGSQLANMRWNPQEMQQFGQQMPGTRTFPGQIFPEAPPLNLFPGGSYQGSVTSPWEGW